MSGVRLGDIPDIDAICDLADELRKTGDYANIKPDEQKFRLFLAGLMGIKTGTVIVVVDDDDKPQGFLLGVVEEFFFSRKRMATDIATYVRKGYLNLAPKMVKKFTVWAESKSRVVRIILGISSGIGDPDRTGQMYENLGFKNTGGIFVKQVMRMKQCQQSQ